MKKLISKQLTSVLMALAVFWMVGASPVLAQTITFDTGSTISAGYVEQGMEFKSLYPSDAHIHLEDVDSDGDRELLNHNGCCSQPYRIKRVDGQPFTLVQMDVVSFCFI